MTSASAFVGSVPQNYDKHMGPMYFRPYAIDLATRIAKYSPKSILETAAGTGIATEELQRANPNATLTATDLNPAMLEIAQSVRPNIRCKWLPADAQELPFESESFDAVVAQYGVMFYPDKAAAFKEAFRVLKPGGVYVFNIWDTLEHNDVGRLVGEALETLMPGKVPPFLQTPWGWADPAPIMAFGKAAGFETPAPETVAPVCEAVTAESAARGLVMGSPLSGQITDEGGDPEKVVAEATRLLSESYGAAPMRCKMQAFVYEFRKPV